MRRRLFVTTIVPVFVAVMLFTGCNSLKNTMDARNSMDVFGQVQAPIDKVWPAVVQASKDMGVVILYQTFDGKQGWIKGFTKRLDHFHVYVYRADSASSSLCIQARTKYVSSAPPEYTDFAFAEAFLKEVESSAAPLVKSP